MAEESMELYAGKRNIKTTFVKLPLKELHFYPANPRISSILLNFKGTLTDDTIHKLMDEKQPEATRTLFQQIKKDGIINEPLVVYKNQVLEGNTRLWVARELLQVAKTQEDKKKWIELPCRLIKDKLTDEEINYLLCNVHIKKKKDWSPFEQACYLARMKNKEKLTLQQISEISTFNVPTIMMYIEVYSEIEKHKAEPGDWNRYYEAYNNRDVREIHRSGRYDVIETIKKKTSEGKMGTAQDSRKLKKIVKSPRATKMFFEGEVDIHRAYIAALADNPEEGDPLLKRIKELDEDLTHIHLDKITEYQKDKTKAGIIKELTEKLNRLCHTLKIKI